MGRDLTFTTAAPSTGQAGNGWYDGVPMSNAEVLRARADQSRVALGGAAPPTTNWKSQPVGGRNHSASVAAPAANNPFAPRVLVPKTMQHERMHGQHGAAMSAMPQFTGAAGVASARAAGAREHQGPRELARRANDFSNAAGAPATKVGRDDAFYHGGVPARRLVADEGVEVRTKAVRGAAAAVVDVA